MDDKILNSQNEDIDVLPIEDIIPENLIRVYPYELSNIKKGRAFLKNNSLTFAYISQTGFDKENLIEDENGEYYFEMLAAITKNGVLDVTSHTSVFGRQLQNEISFTGLSN